MTAAAVSWSATAGAGTLAAAPAQMVFGRPLRPRQPAWVSIAPMMDKTDRHFRRFIRQLTKRAKLYTEMITAEAIIHGPRRQLLAVDPIEHPVVLQLGGNNPQQLGQAVAIAADYGYDEFNLNVGCPSDRVQHRAFGACLMANPSLVAECIAAMAAATTKPVTVKHRLGIRGFGYVQEGYHQLAAFVGRLAQAGCDAFIIHARLAILEGLSPKDNRRVPPLDYDQVWRLKADYPNLPLEINGQITSWTAAASHLNQVDSVMIGRASYQNSWLLADCDQFCCDMDQQFGRPSSQAFRPVSRHAVALDYAAYIDAVCQQGHHNPRGLIWPLLELFNGQPGVRRYRQILSQAIAPGQSVLAQTKQALAHLSPNRPGP